MAVTSTRSIDITLTGDVTSSFTINAAGNTDSAGQMQVVTLSSGFNQFTVPTGGTVPTAVTIIKPTGNTTSITFKGVTGDTGVRLHDTDPDSISLHSGVTTFGLTAGGTITDVRLVFS